MKKEWFFAILQLICLVLLVLSLVFHEDWLLIIAAVIISIIVILKFFSLAKQK